MRRTLLMVALATALLPLTAPGQAGRTMKLMAPVVLGHTASIVMEHPPLLAGSQFAMGMCSPSYPGALSVSVPGVADGVLRLDPLAYGVLGIGMLDASGRSPALTFLVPNDPLLVGASFDVQGADVDGAGLVTLTDDDLEIEVAAPPPASLNMVAIVAGTFSMGSPAALNGPPFYNQASAQPVHPVTITRPFWIGRFEVTQSEYLAVMGSNPSRFQGASYPDSAMRPVERVEWSDAVAYCDALTAQEASAGRLPSGYEYRLPTEAEWEYCCRAGTTTEWNVGNSISCSQANMTLCVPNPPISLGQTRVVGSYAPNAWGLHDMHGNVREWCLDFWDFSVNYPASAVADPHVTGANSHAIRGGDWGDGWALVRSAYRNGLDDSSPPTLGYPRPGFRVVCAPILP